MAVAVIDVLKLVQIDVDNADGLIFSLAYFGGNLEGFIKATSVWYAGQFVGMGLVVQVLESIQADFCSVCSCSCKC